MHRALTIRGLNGRRHLHRPPNWARFSQAAALAVVLAGCAKPNIPAINPEPTNERHIGKFVWHDLLTTDMAASQEFYGEFFGWTFSPTGNDNYVLASLEGGPVAGLANIAGEADVNTSQWVSWISVADVDSATAMTVAAGGTVVRPPLTRPDRGRYSIVTDPTGALLVLVVSSTGDPPDVEAAIGRWLWTELWTDDTDAAVAYYQDLAGFTTEAVDGGVGQDYFVLEAQGQRRAGVTPIPWDWVSSNWLPYLRVSELQSYVTRVEGLGGRVLFAPEEDVRQGSTAIILDPTGAAFALQLWPIPEAGSSQ